MNKNKNQTKTSSAFTIVELLIVIVIIGILAAITIVSYTGITKKANESTVQAELSNAKKQISLYYAEHGVYPKTLGLNNCLSNNTVTPDPDTKYCLKSSGGSTFTLTDATGSDYTLTLAKGTDIAYKVTKDTGPTSTTAVVAAVNSMKAWGGAGNDVGRAIIKSSDGGYAVVGYTTNWGAGASDAFLSKYDSSGNLTWSKTWGGTGAEVGQSLTQSSDGGYVITGYTTSFGVGSTDMFLAKFDTNGSLVWNWTWGGTGQETSFSVIQSSDGGFAVTGFTTSFGSGNNDIFLVKYSASGSLSWNKIWGGANTEYIYSVISTSDGGYALAGYTDSYGAGNSDVLLIKYDSSGNLSWNKLWGGASYDIGYALVQVSDGGYVLTGYTGSYGAGGYDKFLIKFNSSGNLSWNKLWGGTNNEYNQNLIQTSDGGYAAVGYTVSYGAGSDDIILSKYDSSGNLVWDKTWGGAGSDIGYSLIQTVDNSYVITGQTASFGAGGNDMPLIKFSEIGSVDGCSSPMCQSPTMTATTPTATVTTPTAIVSSPTVTISYPAATVTSPTITSTSIVSP